MSWTKGTSMFRGSRPALDAVEVQVQVSEQLKSEREKLQEQWAELRKAQQTLQADQRKLGALRMELNAERERLTIERERQAIERERQKAEFDGWGHDRDRDSLNEALKMSKYKAESRRQTFTQDDKYVAAEKPAPEKARRFGRRLSVEPRVARASDPDDAAESPRGGRRGSLVVMFADRLLTGNKKAGSAGGGASPMTKAKSSPSSMHASTAMQ